MLVSVDDFKQGTLAEAIHLVNTEAYKTDEGATHLIERIWVREPVCRQEALALNATSASPIVACA